MRYAKVSHVIYQSCLISDMLNMNNSKNQKQLMPIIPNINTCKCQSFWRSEMSSYNNVNVNSAQYQYMSVSKVIISLVWRRVMCSPENIYPVENNLLFFITLRLLTTTRKTNWLCCVLPF